MLCPKCSAVLAEGVKFCSECGSRISTASSVFEPKPGGESGWVGHSGMTGEGVGDAVAVGLRSEALGERYELLEKVGEGGFGMVWRARDRKLDRTVAIKRLRAGKDAWALERFEREANLIAGLNHRNVVQVFDCGRDEEGPWIIMEWVAGGSLKDLLKQPGKLPLEEVLLLANGIARGLAHAHRKNLVHRDIKPANILLGRDGEELVPKIVDFGLARGGAESGVSHAGYGMGTPYYMPPEQRRDAKSVNHTADIYALGKTIYEMLTEDVPDAVDSEKISSPELARILKKCCKTNAAERYFSVEDLLRDLDGFKGETKMFGVRVAEVAGGENACPKCQAPNAEDVKFCGGCGTGLTRQCPECDRGNPLRRKYCGSCGTEVDGFDAIKEILSRMERFTGEKEWSQVLNEAASIQKEWRLQGEKGQQFRLRSEELCQNASNAKGRIEQLCEALEAAVQAEKWADGVDAIRDLEGLGPEAGEHGERKADLVKHWDEQDWARAVKEAETLSESGDFAAAVCCYEAYAHAHPEGLHREEVSSSIELLKQQWDEKEWGNACTSVESFGRKGKLRDAVACWKAYVKAHPLGTHVVEARMAEEDWVGSAIEMEVKQHEATGDHVAAARVLLNYLKQGYAQKKEMAFGKLVSQAEVISDELEIAELLPELKGLELEFSDLDQKRLNKTLMRWGSLHSPSAGSRHPEMAGVRLGGGVEKRIQLRAAKVSGANSKSSNVKQPDYLWYWVSAGVGTILICLSFINIEVYWWLAVAGAIPWAIIFYGMSTKCPSCKMWWGAQETSKHETGRQGFLKTITREDKHYDSTGKYSHSTQRQEQVHYTRISYIHNMKCTKCGHTWTTCSVCDVEG